MNVFSGVKPACTIKQEHIEYVEVIYADQSAEVIGENHVSLEALVLREESGKVLTVEKLQSDSDADFELVINKVLNSAVGVCKNVTYRGLEILK
jgi:hypothetical protein